MSKYDENQIEILEYLATDLSGMSARAIASNLISLKGANKNHPHDPDDFGRCARLHDKFPYVQDNLNAMSTVSEAWAKIIKNWDKIYDSMNDEVGLNWEKGSSAPKTYKLMKKILSPYW